jgi:type IV pilus assembly protein PilM
LRDGQQLYGREQAFGGNQLTQDIARLFGMTFEEAETEKRRNNLPDNYESEVLQPFVESMALEVSRALQFFFTSTQFNQVNHIVLSGGCAVLPGADEAVASRTQINTVVANPFAEHGAVGASQGQESACRCAFADGRLRSCLAEV